jgi:hypothetical protein
MVPKPWAEAETKLKARNKTAPSRSNGSLWDLINPPALFMAIRILYRDLIFWQRKSLVSNSANE